MSKQTAFDKLDLLGVEIDALGTSEAIDYICDLAAPKHPAAYVIKPYVEFLDRAYHDPQLQDLLNQADLAIADGVALLWAAAYLYAGKRSGERFWLTLAQIIVAPDRLRWPLPDRAGGISFTWPLLEAAANHGLRVYLIGKEEADDIAAVTRRITSQLPRLNIVGTQIGRDSDSPYGSVSDDWLDRITVLLRDAKPDLVLVGMGFPLQERVSAALASRLDHGVFVGEGGTFDYDSFGGPKRKAPAWMQRTGLEWAWRLILEPRRIMRQLAIPRCIWRIWRSR